MTKCLSKSEILMVLEECAGICAHDDIDCVLYYAIDNARNWDSKLTVLTYFLSQVLEKMSGRGSDCQRIIDMAFSLQDQMWLELEQCNFEFISYMLRCERISDLSLEDTLIEIRNDYEERQYGERFRS